MNMEVSDDFGEACAIVETEFGTEYMRANPQLIVAVMNAMTAQRVAKAIATSSDLKLQVDRHGQPVVA